MPPQKQKSAQQATLVVSALFFGCAVLSWLAPDPSFKIRIGGRAINTRKKRYSFRVCTSSDVFWHPRLAYPLAFLAWHYSSFLSDRAAAAALIRQEWKDCHLGNCSSSCTMMMMAVGRVAAISHNAPRKNSYSLQGEKNELLPLTRPPT